MLKTFIIGLSIMILTTSMGFAEVLTASYYDRASLIKEGTRKVGERQVMANGELFNELGFTTACRLYPLGSILRVTRLDNGKSVIVKVTDRVGRRFARTRIDLSKRAFRELFPLQQGIGKVRVTLLRKG